LAGSLVLRLWGVGFGLPERYHPDEEKYVLVALRYFSGDLNPHYFHNPPLWSYVLGLEFLLYYALGWSFGWFTDLTSFVFRPDLSDVYLLARASAAVVGTATVWLVYRIGTELFTRRVGLIAALLLGVAFLHVRDSHYAVNDVPSTFLLTACFSWCVRVYQRGQRRDYVLAGLLGGLAVATKYSTGIIAVSLLTAHALRCRRAGQPLSSNGGNRLLIAAAAASALGFLLGCPYALLDPAAFARGLVGQVLFGARAWAGQSTTSRVVLWMEALARGFGAAPLVVVLATVVLWLRRRGEWKRTILLLSFPTVYLVCMLNATLFFVRFALPLLPFLSLFAAVGVERLSSTSRIVHSLALLLLVTQSVVFGARHNILLCRLDTRQLLAKWCMARLPTDATIATEGYAPTLVSYSPNRPKTPLWGRDYTRLNKWLRNRPSQARLRVVSLYHGDRRYQRISDLDTLSAAGVQYVAVSSFIYDRNSPAPPPPFYRTLEGRARLLVRISPRADGGPPSFRLDHLYSPFFDLFVLERPGPELRVYRIGLERTALEAPDPAATTFDHPLDTR
jgi:4-amino-4-deoxy-L-arabinose transferase-like glycosyltransferase